MTLNSKFAHCVCRRSPALLLALVLVALLPRSLHAQAPGWWQQRGVMNGGASDDYAAINQGQLKNLVRAAVEEMDSALSLHGGAGAPLHQLVTGWVTPTAQTDDYAAVNLGQLKTVARPVYDRLVAVGVADGYPWGTSVTPPDDFAVANIGQAKNLFSFNILKDTDGDGLPDWWERKYGLNPNDPSDANATAAGGGMTNGQHFGQGSNPNQAPPPATIAAAVPTLDQNADTLLYPADDSTLLLKNGNFSTPAVPARNWDTYPGIVGWTAISGTAISGNLIEIQKIVPNPGGQYCELDSHWHDDNPTHTGASDHGIQQTVSLKRGHYILIFDYRARQVNATTTAGDFTVKVKSEGGSDLTLVAKNGAAVAWKRATASFDISGGNPNLTQIPVTLKFDIADAPDSYGAFIDNVILLPVEFQTTDITKGFDYPLQDDPPDAYTVGMTPPTVKDQDNPEWWTSVARTDASGRGQNVNNHVKLVFGSVAAATLCEIHSSDTSLLSVDGDGVGATGNLTKAETLLALTGRNSATKPGIQTVDVQVRTKDSNHQVLLILKVLVMPERKVRLRVHFVEDHTLNINGIYPLPRYLSQVPDAYKDVPDIVQKLNEVYRQNCLTFVSDGSGTLDVKGWDSYLGELTDAALFNFRKKFTPEAGVLHILVFRKINAGPGVLGFQPKNFWPNCVFVGATNHEEWAKAIPFFRLTCAHEVGHALQLSIRHSKDTLNRIHVHDNGVFPLRYNDMHSLMQAEGDPAHPEHTWLRHEEWQPAWREAGNYLLP